MKRETRFIQKAGGRPSIRSTETGQIISGYAAIYNLPSVDLGGFREIFMPGCFDEAIKTSDIRILINHDPNLILGRNRQTAVVWCDDFGLRFTVKLGRTTTSSDAYEAIRRRDLSGCSVTMIVENDSWRETGGEWTRRIHRVSELFDVGPGVYPAYLDTSVGAFEADDPFRMQRVYESETESLKQKAGRRSYQTPKIDAGYRRACALIERLESLL